MLSQSLVHAAYSLTAAQIDDLKASVDLRDVVEQDLGPGQHAGKWRKYCSPFREEQHPSFAVCEGLFIDFGNGDHGDILTWLQRRRGLSFQDALLWLLERNGGSSSVNDAPRRVERTISTATAIPPLAHWQQIAWAETARAERYLWSENGEEALKYLRDVRGLSDDTIRYFRLGYNPNWRRTEWIKSDTGKFAHLAPGIVIPWIIDGQIWALKVRCRVGNLAETLHIDPDHFPHSSSELPKYLNLAGGNQAGALFNADSIVAGQNVLFLEGEFDVMLCSQYADGKMGIVTLGSATYGLPTLWSDRLDASPLVLSALDNDVAGENGTQVLAAALGEKHRCGTVDAGKDFTEFVIDHHGNAQAWLQAAPTLFTQLPEKVQIDYWVNGLPDYVRRAGLTFLTPSLVLVAELRNAAAQQRLLMPGTCFTLQQLFQCSSQLGWGIKISTITEAMVTDLDAGGVFFEKLDPVFSFTTESGVESGSKNPKNTGRPAALYKALPIGVVIERLIGRAYFRLIEKYHPIDSSEPVLAEITPAWFTALGYSEDEAKDLALQTRLRFTNMAQDEQAVLRAKYEYKIYRRELTDAKDYRIRTTPLPEEWTYDSPVQYRAAYLRGVVEADLDCQRSRRTLAQIIGICEASVTAYLGRAGLENVDQFEEKPLLASASVLAQIKQAEGELKGHTRWLVSFRDGVRHEFIFDRNRSELAQCWFESEMMGGGEVIVRVQVASLQRVRQAVSMEFIGQVGSEERISSNSGQLSGGEQPERKLKYYGTGFNPQWVIAQLVLWEALARGYLCKDGRVFDRDTGEIYASVSTIGAGRCADIKLLDWLVP